MFRARTRGGLLIIRRMTRFKSDAWLQSSTTNFVIVACFAEPTLSDARPNIRAKTDFKLDCLVLSEITVNAEESAEGISLQIVRFGERHVQTIKEQPDLLACGFQRCAGIGDQAVDGEKALIPKRCGRLTERNLACDTTRQTSHRINNEPPFNRLGFEQTTSKIPNRLKEARQVMFPI
jgi:hypothetical protein